MKSWYFLFSLLAIIAATLIISIAIEPPTTTITAIHRAPEQMPNADLYEKRFNVEQMKEVVTYYIVTNRAVDAEGLKRAYALYKLKIYQHHKGDGEVQSEIFTDEIPRQFAGIPIIDRAKTSEEAKKIINSMYK